MESLSDVGQVESCFDPFGDSVSIGARYVLGLRQIYHRLRNCFRPHLMLVLGDEAQVTAQFHLFGDSANPDAS
jgi:hypothetical protein